MNIHSSDSNRDISLADLLAVLRSFGRVAYRDRTTVFYSAAAAALVGLFISFGSGEEFSAKSRVLPNRNVSNGVGSLSGIAGLAGIRLPAGGDQTVTAELYPEVAKSLDFRIRVAETPIYFSSLGRRATTVEFFRDLRRPPASEYVVRYTVGLPGQVLAAIRSGANSSRRPNSAPADSGEALPAYNLAYLKLVGRLVDRLIITMDKKTSIITIEARMPDPYAAADLVRVASGRLIEQIREYESLKAVEQFDFVNNQHQLARLRYERTQRDLALFADRNRALMTATSQVDRDRLQREYDLAFELFQQLSRDLEQARVKLNQDTPVFTVLEQVSVPPGRTSPKRALIMLSAMLFGVTIGLGTIAVREII